MQSNELNLLNEPPVSEWGGKWTEIKLQAFIEYVVQYLKILNKYPKYKTIYYDGFAGSGEKLIRKEKEIDLFHFDLSNQSLEEIKLYQGSVSRVLSLQKPYLFDYYYFIETDDESVDSLKRLKRTIKHISQEQIIIRKDDSNSQLTKLADALHKKKLAALILLDPFGMQINWNSVQKLMNTHSDVWILIPSGVAINRLLDRAKEVKSIKRLEEFFGLGKDKIISIFYPEQQKETLFGVQTTTEKIKHPIDKIIEIYREQLKTIWEHVSKPLILRNSKNNPIFHFLFASNNAAGLRIANHIIEKSASKK